MNASLIQWILHWLMGCELQLLSRCSESERHKFIYAGILVLVVTFLTGISSIYIAIDVLVPALAQHDVTWYLDILFATCIALCWTAIIFNLFRFFIATVPSSGRVNFKDAGELSKLMLQLFFASVLSIGMGIPLTVFVLNSQIDLGHQHENNLKADKISMTFNFMEKHQLNSEINKQYEILQNLKLNEAELQQRSALYKSDVYKLEELKLELVSNQRRQEDEIGKISLLRQAVEADFKKMKEIDHTLSLNQRIVFIWKHNLPICVFSLTFIFLVYVSLLIAKAITTPGCYEHLVKYEGIYSALSKGIVQTHKPAVVDGEQIRFLRFFGPELLFEAERSSLAKNTEALHAQLKKEIHHGKNIESAITRIKT